MAVFRRILHPTDFSKASARAFRSAVGLAVRGRGELVLLHVVSPQALALEDSFLTARAWQQIEAGALAVARKQVQRLRRRAVKAGARARIVVARGAAVQQILETARRLRADVIVVGTHGRTGFRRALLGSVAERVVGAASVPVLTVRGGSGRAAA